MATYQGGCHCGAIAFVLDAEISEGYDCNCSLCRKRGGPLGFFPREALVLSTPESALGTYRFHKHAIDHHFCPQCGVAPFSEGVDPRSGARTAAVNLRCLPDLDLDTLKRIPVDGAAL